MYRKLKLKLKKKEQNVADDILNNIKSDYDEDDATEPPPHLQIREEMDKDRINESKEFVETRMQIRSRDFETIDNIDEENKKELLKSVIDPLDGQYVNNNITPSDYTRDDNNNPVQTGAESPVLRVINDIINIKVLRY